MSAGTEAARAIVRGMPVRRPGLDLRPHGYSVETDLPLCRCGYEAQTWGELGRHVSAERAL